MFTSILCGTNKGYCLFNRQKCCQIRVVMGSEPVGRPPVAATWSWIPSRQLNLLILICWAPGTHASLRYVKSAVKHLTCPVNVYFHSRTKINFILGSTRLKIIRVDLQKAHLYKDWDIMARGFQFPSQIQSGPILWWTFHIIGIELE